MRFCVLLLSLTSVLCAQAQRKLLVISVDGLDARYLNDADRLGLRIPHLRKLKATGAAAAGVVGIVPTVTWPSHTTLITGVGADEHGIVSNDQPGKPGQRWWFTSFVKARTLWQSAAEKKLKTAAVYWPVTVGDGIDLNFPEFWEERKGHEVLFAPIASKATAGLEERVARVYPSFPRSQWSDTSAMQAVRYLLEFENPDLTLVHIADLDSEAHDYGAFKKQSKAVLEHADYLIGWALEKLPPPTLVAIVSDHGFENAERVVRPKVMLRDAGVTGTAQVSQGLIGTRDAAVAVFFRTRTGKGEIAREVPLDEVRRMAPSLGEWIAAFETASGHRAINDESGPAVSPGDGRGDHGLWPTRAGYRASFMLWGPGIRHAQLGEISMLEIAPTFAEILGVALPAAKAKSLWPRIAR